VAARVPAVRDLHAPDESIVLTVADNAVRNVVFRVHDAETGQALRASIGLSSGPRTMRAAGRGETVVRDVPVREPFAWSARASGYERARGGPEHLRPAPSHDDPGRLAIDVVLRRPR
jgi:hypothetical protein